MKTRPIEKQIFKVLAMGVAIVLAGVFCAMPVFAGGGGGYNTTEWTDSSGNGAHMWNYAPNWGGPIFGQIPDSGYDAYIYNGGMALIEPGTTAQAHKLTLGDGGIYSGNIVMTGGTLTMTEGRISPVNASIYSEFTQSGLFTASGNNFYWHIRSWPGSTLCLAGVRCIVTEVTDLSTGKSYPFKQEEHKIVIEGFPKARDMQMPIVIRFRTKDRPMLYLCGGYRVPSVPHCHYDPVTSDL